MKNRNKIIYHPRNAIKLEKPKRTRSYFEIIDTKTKNKKRFAYSKDLGQGRYGYVRLFECGDEKVAVKAIREDIKEGAEFDSKRRHLTMDEVKSLQEQMETEFEYMQAAYPDDPYYSIHHYHEAERDEKGRVYDCRITMPFVPGKKLDDFANDHITDAADMARLMLRVAEELHRLHVEAGLIHGDAGARNILVDNVDDDYNVHLLDFGMTYPADGYAIVNFERPTSSDITSADMAHERYPNRKLKARPAQDVFTIAKTFRKLIKKRDTEWLDEFYARFPVIKNFIKMGLRKDWKNRPDLADFIENLESNLDWMVNLPKSVNKIAVTIESENWNRLKVLLKANNTPSEDLARLLHYLILNQKYEGTRHLIRYRKKIPAYSFFHGDTALHAAAANRDIDPAFFAELLAYIPKSDTVSAINLTNNAGDTVMHCAAESGCKDVVLELLKYHPDLSIRNDEGKTPIEAAQQSIMPVLEFIKYLQDLENQRETASPRMFSKSVRTKHHRLLDAARFVEECILTNNVDEDEYETFRGIIEDSPELSGHVQNLIHSEWLQTADSGFNLYSLLGF